MQIAFQLRFSYVSAHSTFFFTFFFGPKISAFLKVKLLVKLLFCVSAAIQLAKNGVLTLCVEWSHKSAWYPMGPAAQRKKSQSKLAPLMAPRRQRLSKVRPACSLLFSAWVIGVVYACLAKARIDNFVFRRHKHDCYRPVSPDSRRRDTGCILG